MLGDHAVYVRADISTTDGAEYVIRRTKQQYGTLNGIIHAAGELRDGLIWNKSRKDFETVLAAKVRGVEALDAATCQDPLDCFILFSSIAGLFGNAGQSDYAYANAYLDALADAGGDTTAEEIIRSLLGRAANRLQLLCTTLLFRSYPRLSQPPLSLQAEEMLSAVVERLLKAMRGVRPETVRAFFALANQHMRWELNDLARRLDKEARAVELRESIVAAPQSSGSQISPNTRRILEAIDNLPEEEREVFELVRVQGMTHPEVAQLLGISAKTVQRRMNRGLVLLTSVLGDLMPAPSEKS